MTWSMSRIAAQADRRHQRSGCTGRRCETCAHNGVLTYLFSSYYTHSEQAYKGMGGLSI